MINKCLILAAGRGRRLSSLGEPKPLVRLLGLTLIERVILTLRRCGIEEFYVVTGYKGKEVRDFLDKLSIQKGIRIVHVINEEWEKENGLSVLKAKGKIKGKFLLCMCDHIFQESMVKKVMEYEPADEEICLCVDFRLNNPVIPDTNEATKVLVEDGRIKDIGKKLKKYNGYDTGLFLVSQKIFSAIEESIRRNNDSSLSGAIRILAKEGLVRAIDAGKDAFWIDIDDEKAYKRAEKELLNMFSQKDTDGPVSRYLNRYFSAKITKYLINTNITPNEISLFSFLMCIIASLAFLLGKYSYLLFGGILAQISSIIDGCDGEIARLKFQSSKFGAWLDAILDRYSDAFLLFGLTVYAYNPLKPLLTLSIGFLAIIGSFVNSYMADKYDQYMRREFQKLKKHKPIRIGRDIRVMLIFLGALMNQVFFTLVLIAFIMNLENIRRIIILYRNQEILD